MRWWSCCDPSTPWETIGPAFLTIQHGNGICTPYVSSVRGHGVDRNSTNTSAETRARGCFTVIEWAPDAAVTCIVWARLRLLCGEFCNHGRFCKFFERIVLRTFDALPGLSCSDFCHKLCARNCPGASWGRLPCLVRKRSILLGAGEILQNVCKSCRLFLSPSPTPSAFRVTF